MVQVSLPSKAWLQGCCALPGGWRCACLCMFRRARDGLGFIRVSVFPGHECLLLRASSATLAAPRLQPRHTARSWRDRTLVPPCPFVGLRGIATLPLTCLLKWGQYCVRCGDLPACRDFGGSQWLGPEAEGESALRKTPRALRARGILPGPRGSPVASSRKGSASGLWNALSRV